MLYILKASLLNIIYKHILTSMLNPNNLKWIRLWDDTKQAKECGWTAKGSKSIRTGEPDTKNWGILTGKRNGIFVLDLDSNKWTQDKCEAMRNDSDGEHPFVKEFGKSFGKDFNTYSVKSKSGGAHLYFKYDEDIIKNATCNYHQIDIRAKNGYIVAPGSAIGGSSYDIILNTTVKECPPKLKEWILDQIIHKNYRKGYNPTGTKGKIYKSITNGLVDNRLWNYNISDKEIIAIVNKLPKDFINNYEDWFKLTTFFKVINKKKIWNQICKQGDGYDKHKNYQIWDTCNDVDIEIVKYILGVADCRDSLTYIKYKPILDNNEPVGTTITRSKLGINELGEQVDFLSELGEHKYKVIKSDTGTGKTTATKKYFKNNNKKFISIVSRRSLGMEQYRTFNGFGVDCGYYTDHWFMKQGTSFITTIDSFFKRCSMIDFSEYVIFMDEFSSILNYVIDADTLGNDRIILLKFLVKALRNCKEVIMTDADIDGNCFHFIKYLTEDFLYVKNTFIHNQGVSAVEYTNEDDILDRLKQTDKWIICTDSKTLADNYFRLLDDPTIKVYTSDNDEDLEMDNWDKLIYSPKVVYGLDSSMEREVFAIYKERTIDPKNMLQQIARCRNITRLNYLFTKKQMAKPRYAQLSDTVEYLLESNTKSVGAFGLLASEEINELYIHLLGRLLFNKDAYSTNKFSHFKLLLKKRGFIDVNINGLTKFNKKVHAELSKQNKEERIRMFDPEEPKNERINKYLKLPDNETIVEHMDLFLDNHALNEHFRVCNFMFKSPEETLRRLKKSKDFNVKTLQKTGSKIYYLHKLITMFDPDHKDATIRPTIKNTITAEQSAQVIKGFQLIWNVRMKKEFDLSQTIDCERMINKLYCQLFKNVLVQTKTTVKVGGKDKRFKKWVIDKGLVAEHKGIYDYRAMLPVLQFLPEDEPIGKKAEKGFSQTQIDSFFKFV